MTRIPLGLKLEPGVQACVFGIISRVCDDPTDVWWMFVAGG